MSEDFFVRHAHRTNNARYYGDGIFSHALRSINMLLRSNGRSLEQFQLPIPRSLLPGEGNILIDEERSKYNANAQSRFRDVHVPKLNEQQTLAYETIMQSITAVKEYNAFLGESEAIIPQYPNVPTCFFVDGLGGAGKTFLYNTLLSSVRADNGIALAVPSSGIAALLLEGGRTAHSRLKIPVNGINDLSTCSITKQSQVAELIVQVTDLIIWDEAPMQHKFDFQAVDRTFRDLTGIDKPFGGKIVVMGGDFRQVLPVIPRADNAQVVDASLNRSFIWKFVHVIYLHQNMRVQTMIQDGDIENAERQENFSDWLKRIG